MWAMAQTSFFDCTLFNRNIAIKLYLLARVTPTWIGKNEIILSLTTNESSDGTEWSNRNSHLSVKVWTFRPREILWVKYSTRTQEMNFLSMSISLLVMVPYTIQYPVMCNSYYTHPLPQQHYVNNQSQSGKDKQSESCFQIIAIPQSPASHKPFKS